MRGRHGTGRHGKKGGGGVGPSFLLALLIVAFILGFTWYLAYAR